VKGTGVKEGPACLPVCSLPLPKSTMFLEAKEYTASEGNNSITGDRQFIKTACQPNGIPAERALKKEKKYATV